MTTNVDAWLNIWRRTPPGATKTVLDEARARDQHDECLVALLIQIRETVETNHATRTTPDTPKETPQP